MDPRWFRLVTYILVSQFLFISPSSALGPHDERLVGVSLRMIGHRVLLNAGDSTSRVLPIIKEDDRYRIQFESHFAFIPEKLVATIDSIMKETRIANAYIVEVEKCETEEVVYSYQIKNLEQTNIVHCQSRLQPKSCYHLLFTLMENKESMSNLPNAPSNTPNGSDFTNRANIILVILFVVMAAILYFRERKKRLSTGDPNLIHLGEYQFDKRNTELVIEDQRIELTSKEANLLMLLYEAVNTTVEREVILNMVWGDEGDYVGRTLDVFISRLRKKLEADANVKIVNIRGVGYKLVMNV